MLVWPALLIAPLLALVEQSLAYALTPAACWAERAIWLQLLPLPFIAATSAATVLAWQATRRYQPSATGPLDAKSRRSPFLAWLAIGSGALSTLLIVALAIPTWLLSPCAA
jgi:hypothetical protein